MSRSTEPRRFFDAIARRYDRVYALSGAASRGRLTRVLAAIQGKERVLVLGIGTGRELPALLDAGHVVHGVDFSPEMVAILGRRSRTVETTITDFYAPLPFPDGAFDAALALHGTLAHPPDDEALGRLGRELARVLTPSGVFVAEVPAAEGMARIAAERPGEGMSVSASQVGGGAGGARFAHVDEVAGVSIEGIALTGQGWAEALGPALTVRVEPLGEAEHFLVAGPTRG